jgi:class 3 adenylate cyclase
MLREANVMSSGPRPVTDEAVRGVVAPPWLVSLPGIKRVRLYSDGLLPLTPFARLCGFGLGHVSVGSLTATMKASGILAFPPLYNLSPLFVQALRAGALTAVGPGEQIDPVSVSAQYSRPARPQPGNFLAHVRVANASSAFVSCTADIEDPVGRLVASVGSQWRVRRVETPPPAAPATFEPAQDATYPTPDPPDRPAVGALPTAGMQDRHSGWELLQMTMSGALPPIPMMNTFGASIVGADDGECEISMPASEWLCGLGHDLEPGAVETAVNMAGSLAAVTLGGVGKRLAVLDQTTHYLRPVSADGRQLSVRGRVTYRQGEVLVAESVGVDADGEIFAIQRTAGMTMDTRQRRTNQPERILTTLLFTDIVDSTGHAERMGDARWKSALDDHHALVRQQLGAHQGREVKTTGDGFLARFDSPAQAVHCANAVRSEMRRFGLEIRSGIHTGECEVQGTDLAGIALHTAARIMGLAGPGEILTSQTVRDLAAGSALDFEDRGPQTLRGIQGQVSVFAVND